MADNASFFRDSRAPFILAAVPAVTLATTLKALYPVANIPAMGKDYWWGGKKIKIGLRGQITTAVTPGNLVISVLYGTGADANGVTLQSTAALTLIASQTNLTWEVYVWVRCVTPGSAGVLFCSGTSYYNAAVVAAHHGPIPASAAANSGAVDLTVASNVISVQASRSGSTAETMQVLDMEVEALN